MGWLLKWLGIHVTVLDAHPMSRYDYLRSKGIADPEATLTEIRHKTDLLERDRTTGEWEVKQEYVETLKQIFAEEDEERQRLKRLEEKS